MTTLSEVAQCPRSSFSGWRPRSPALASSAGGDGSVSRQATTFRPVVAAAVRSLYCADRKSAMLVGACPPPHVTSCYEPATSWSPISTSDDESYGAAAATRKRRHDDSSDDALTSSAASDDDEEIRTILCDEQQTTMTSRAPGNGAAMTSDKRHCALLPRTQATAANDCGAVQRPSLNFYKMQVSSVITWCFWLPVCSRKWAAITVAHCNEH